MARNNDKVGNLIYPYFYHQVLGEYSIKIPNSWSGKYTVNSTDNTIRFAQNATYEKYGSSILFTIEKVSADRVEEILNMLGGSELLYKNDEYAYIFEVPTDVQYPIWVERDEEDMVIAAEHETMFEQVNFIKNSFDLLVQTSPYYDNKESLSLDDITVLQNDVDNGHYLWRLDPTQTILEYANSNNIGNGEITELTGTGVLVNASYTTGGDTYLVELFKPIRQNKTGIWVVRVFEKFLN